MKDYNKLLEQNPALRKALDLTLSVADSGSVCSPEDVVPMLMGEFADKEREHAIVVALDSANRVIDYEVISIGSHRATIMSVSTILRWVLTRERPAAGFILAHNHPSGDVKPSRQDIETTKRFDEAAKLVELTLLDHIIIGGVKYRSMKGQGDF